MSVDRNSGPEVIIEKLRHPGTSEGDDLVILTGTEAVELLDEIDRLQAVEVELEARIESIRTYCHGLKPDIDGEGYAREVEALLG